MDGVWPWYAEQPARTNLKILPAHYTDGALSTGTAYTVEYMMGKSL